MLNFPRIRPLAEDPDIDFLVKDAGGRRAHHDHHSRELRNSDYVLGSSILELKLLEDERLDKPEAQEKIADIFADLTKGRPVVVLDPGRLDDKRRKAYDTIMRAPIKAAVASARGQLKQSRIEINPDACNVLLVINNGFTAVSQEDLLSYVAGRAKNDTNEIDAVVVAGCYFHSDGMDSWALWPMDCVTIRSDRPFLEFDMLKASWGKLANRHMTDFVQGKHGENAQKETQTDVVFDVGDTTYVKPAVQIGAASQFYGNARPRRNRVTFDQVKHVVYTVPRLSPLEYRRVSPALRDEPLMASYEVWDAHVAAALRSGTLDRPVVPADISHARWEAWLRKNPGRSGIASLRAAANSLYGARASELVHAARQPDESERLPKRYIWVLVELIGQDERNDVAHMGVIIDGEERPLVSNVRMGHYSALSLAAGYAIKLEIDKIYWRHDLTYAWT